MPAKFMHIFGNENPELQKQIGCVTGIFEMFDRHHLLGGRRFSGHIQKMSGHTVSNVNNVGAESNACSPQVVLEKNISKSSSEYQRASMGSPGTSFSSSCSSSSSLEFSKSTQQELSSFNRPPERYLKTSPKLNSSNNGTRHAIFEPCSDTLGLSIKTSNMEAVNNCAMKYRESPRPDQLSIDEPYMIGINGKSRMHVDVDVESHRVLMKHKKEPLNYSEVGETRSSYVAKATPFSGGTPRFSCDGREISLTSLDSRGHNKNTSKHRLSLDSKEHPQRSSNFDSTPNLTLKLIDTRDINQVPASSNLQQDLGSHKRSPGIVAKLMGLEALPNWGFTAQELVTSTTYTNKDIDPSIAHENNFSLSKSSRCATEDRKKDWLSHSRANSLKDPIIMRKPDSVMKSISNSKAPIETAPWLKRDKHISQRAAFVHQEAHVKQRSGSGYSEIEKHLEELEFRQSNRDLRELKQILDTMRAKGLLEIESCEEQHSQVLVRKNNRSNQIPTGDDQSLKSANVQNQQVTHPDPTLMKGRVTRALNSPIIVMKPAKSIKRSDLSASSLIPLEGLSDLRKVKTSDPMVKNKASGHNRVFKTQTPKANCREVSNQPLVSVDKKFISRREENISHGTRSRMVQCSPRGNNGSSMKTPSSLSPRIQQRKLEMESKVGSPLHSSESNQPRRPLASRQPSESVSPRDKHRRKPTQMQENDDQLSQSSGTKNLSQLGDDLSLRSYSNISSTSQVDMEVTSADKSADMDVNIIQQNNPTLRGRAVDNGIPVLKQMKSSLCLNEDVSTMELESVAPEQPSPISVLDSSFYEDNLPHSPMKRSSDALHADNLPMKVSFKINQKKLENIENLVQKLRELSSSDDESTTTTDPIASLCETQNSVHQYVCEILLASGILLKDGPTGSIPIHLHPSGKPINPDLFLVLEQTKSGSLSEPETIYETPLLPTKSDPKKLHRKLVFDMVNEILIQKLKLASHVPSINLFLRARKLTGGFPSGQNLLRELCSEIVELQPENSRRDIIEDGSEGWIDFGREVNGVVLEIERSLFRELIDEVISTEAASVVQSKSSRRHRQLFAN